MVYNNTMNKDKYWNITRVLEWFSTLIVVIGVGTNALGHHPEGPIIMTVGSIFWVIVGVRWKSASIIITNSVICIVSTIGLIVYHLNT